MHPVHLAHESATILHALFALALSPARSFPPLTHPAHTSWLTELCASWTARAHPYYNYRSFARLLVDALLAAKCAETWTCKATNKIAAELREKDLAAFVHLPIGLCQTVMALTGRKRRGKGTNPEPVDTLALRTRLSQWIRQLSGNVLLEDQEQSTDAHNAALDFLVSVRHLWLRFPVSARWQNEDGEVNVDGDIHASVVCLATHLLTHFLRFCTAEEECVLVGLLNNLAPKPDTYASLVTHIFSAKAGGEIEALAAYTAVLKERVLLRCEASLWSCALTHLDLDLGVGCIGTSIASKTERAETRAKLIELVDDAERRCFGTVHGGPHEVGSTGKRRLVRTLPARWRSAA